MNAPTLAQKNDTGRLSQRFPFPLRRELRALALVATALATLVFPLAQSARATTFSWTGATNGNMSGVTTNYSPNGTPGSGDVISWNAASYTTAPSANVSGTIGELLFDSGNTGGVTFSGSTGTLTLAGVSNIGIQLNAGTGAVSTNGAKFALGASQSWLNNSANSFTAAGTINLSTFALTIDGSGASTLSGAISGSGSLIKTGAGTLILSANSYTGGTTISAGTVKLNATTALGGATGAVSVASGAVLDLNGITMVSATNALTINGSGINSGGALTNTSSSGAGAYTGLVTLGSDSSIIASGSSITLSNVGTITGSGFNLTVGGAKNTSIASIIGTGAGGLTKRDAGTLTLTGANTYTGTTTVNGGTLTLGNGTIGSLSSSSTLATGGNGIFNFTGAAAATQTVAGFNANQGFGTVNNTVAGTTLNLGAATQSAGGMVYFATTTGTIASTTNTNGIIGPWAFLGAGATLDYAVANGANVAISGLGAGTTLPSAGPGVATTNYILSGSQTQTANAVGNTLRYSGTTGTLALGATSLGLSGLMNAGTGLLTITGSAGNSGLVTTGELDIASNNTGGITINSVVSGAGSVVSGGVGTTVGASATGLVTLSGSNTYNGGTVINSGALRATTNTALGTGDVTVTNGAQLQLHGGVTIANTININGANALFTSTATGGNPNLTGIVNLQSASGISLTTSSGNGAMILSGSLNLNGNVLSVNTNGSQYPSVTISGIVSGTSAGSGILAAGAGVTRITGSNSSYTGTTTVNGNGGVVELGNDSALGTGIFAFKPQNDLSAIIRSTGSTIRTTAAAVTFVGGNAGSRYVFGSTTASVNGDLTFTSATAISLSAGQKLIEVGNRTQFDAGFTGSGGLTMQTTGSTGLGTLVLNGANTYTGATTINAGTLQLGNGGTTGSLSSTTVISGTTGGTLAFNRSDAMTLGNNISGALAVTQIGTGSTTLSGTSTYTGATTVKAGTLIVSGSLSGSSAVTVGDSTNLATVAILGGSGGVGNVTAGAAANNTGASIDPGNSAGVAGILKAGSLTVQNGAHLAMQIGGSNAGGEVSTGYDQIVASSTVSLSGGDLKLTLNGSPTFGSSDVLYLIINNSTAAVASQFSTVTLNGGTVSDTGNIVLNGQQFSLVYNANFAGGDNVANDVALMAVPEPGTWAMVMGGFGMLIAAQRMRRRNA